MAEYEIYFGSTPTREKWSPLITTQKLDFYEKNEKITFFSGDHFSLVGVEPK
jgi:hypothetical protein